MWPRREGLNAFEEIGAESREVIERRPASVVVAEVVKKKFVRKAERQALSTAVLVADTPELPIPRGMAGPGMLADTVVKRWQDHLPLHRTEAIFRRAGIDLNRSTICGWHIELADLVEPLMGAMHADALAQPCVCVDATRVLVQDRERCRNGHFWVLVAPPKHTLFQFSDKHDGAAVDRLLPDYLGIVVAAHTCQIDALLADDLPRAPVVGDAGYWGGHGVPGWAGRPPTRLRPGNQRGSDGVAPGAAAVAGAEVERAGTPTHTVATGRHPSPGCDSAWKIDPLSGGIGVQN